MRKISLRTCAEILTVGILLLIAGMYAVKYYLSVKEYDEYRGGIFARSYESLLSVLSEYRTTGAPYLSSQISFCLASLPLSAEEEDAAARFSSDIHDAEYDSEAKSRATLYCDELIRFLSQSRSLSYQENWRASGMGIPPYPESDPEAAPTATMPQEKDDGGKEELRDAALALLGTTSRLTSYSYQSGDITVFGYRTGFSYAEYRSDTKKLIKALIHRKQSGGFLCTESEILQAAESLLNRFGYEKMKLVSSKISEGAEILLFENSELQVTVGITRDQCELCLFLVSFDGMK